MSRRFFVTGAYGFLGAWIVKTLLDRGDSVSTFELGGSTHRLDALLSDEQAAQVMHHLGDIAESASVRKAMEKSEPDRIIHLAGLQVPMCKADPIAGAHVNVVGTLNVFEAAHALDVGPVVYASSAAVYGPAPADIAIAENEYLDPRTHYGVFKTANEGNARVYWNDNGVASAGLRPLTIYGLGRDQGMTSAPTTAMKAAVLGLAHNIPFTGPTDLLYAADAASAFIACADELTEGAHVFNIAGESATIDEVVAHINSNLNDDQQHLVTSSGGAIPIAPRLSGDALCAATGFRSQTSLKDGIAATMSAFRELHAAGRLDCRDLPKNNANTAP